jgi:hypothetical protein
MSEDGSTIAAGSGSRIGFGVDSKVVVFRKVSTRWVEEAQLLPSLSNQERGGSATIPLDINGDGTVIALGAPGEVRVDADPDALDVGAVHVFRRTSTGWVEEQRLAPATSAPEEAFGRHVSLDECGTLLAVWRRWGEGTIPSAQGPVELFRHTNAGWVPLATIPSVGDECHAMALSGDGNTLVRSCGAYVEILTAPSWQRVAWLPNEFSGEGPVQFDRRIAVSFDGRVVAARTRKYEDFETETYRTFITIYRQGASGWMRETTMTPGPWVPRDALDYTPSQFGGDLSLSRDGRFLAVGSAGDDLVGTGARYPPLGLARSHVTGAVYVFERRPTGWRLRQFLKPNFDGVEFLYFGAAVSLARNGKDLAVGAPNDASNALGIDGDQEDTSAPTRGAVWLY